MRRIGVCYLTALAVLAVSPLAAEGRCLYESMAARIVSALQVTRGERVLLRVDPNTMPQLAPIVRKGLEVRGAVVDVSSVRPGAGLRGSLGENRRPCLVARAGQPPRQAVRRSPCSDGSTTATGREIHFHWVDGNA